MTLSRGLPIAVLWIGASLAGWYAGWLLPFALSSAAFGFMSNDGLLVTLIAMPLTIGALRGALQWLVVRPYVSAGKRAGALWILSGPLVIVLALAAYFAFAMGIGWRPVRIEGTPFQVLISVSYFIVTLGWMFGPQAFSLLGPLTMGVAGTIQALVLRRGSAPAAACATWVVASLGTWIACYAAVLFLDFSGPGLPRLPDSRPLIVWIGGLALLAVADALPTAPVVLFLGARGRAARGARGARPLSARSADG